MPSELDDYFPWLLSQSADTVHRLLAYVTAIATKGIYRSAPAESCNEPLARALNLDMTRWWKVGGASYLDHVPKGRIFDVVRQAVDEAAALPLVQLKKAEAVAAAEHVLRDTGWLPDVLRVRAVETSVPRSADEPEAG